MMELTETVLRAYVPESDYFDARSADAAEVPEADLPHYLYGLARLAFLRQGLFSAHAACVGTDAGYVLLFGHSGDGKTTVSLRLVREHGYRLYAGNKTVVEFADGAVAAVAGTKTISELTSTGRRFFRLEEKEYAPRSAMPIRAMVKVKLNDGVAELKRLAPLSALHALYPFFLDAVNADIIVGKGTRVLPGDPPDGVRERLATELLQVFETVPAYALAGSLAYVVSSIQEI